MEIVTKELDVHLASILKNYKNCLNTNLGLQALQQLKFETSTKTAISNLLLTYLIKVETLSAGASDLMLQLLLNVDKNNKIDCNNFCQKLDGVNLKTLISTYVDKGLADLVHEAICLAGLNGKVVLLNQQHNEDVVELNDGSFFPDVVSILKLKNSKYLGPKVICIDGYVESVSEIHRILEDASQIKDNVFLFVRGMSDDVAHTIKVNCERGSLSILPFIVKYDLDGVNLLNDIAIVSGGDLISTLKGQLINNVDISLAPRVDYINISEAGILVEKCNTRLDVDRHILLLQKKLLEVELTATKELMAKRIKNLGSNRVTISLKADHNTYKRSFMIDRALRAIKIAATHGVIEYNGNLYPLTSLKVAEHYYSSFFKEYNRLGCIIS